MQLDTLSSKESKLDVDLNSIITIYVAQRKQVICLWAQLYVCKLTEMSGRARRPEIGGSSQGGLYKDLIIFYKVNIFV